MTDSETRFLLRVCEQLHMAVEVVHSRAFKRKETSMENTALCHSILDDEGVPRAGPFAPLSLADRISWFVALHHAIRDANKVLRKDAESYEIKDHSAYVAIWENGIRIAKVPISDSDYGLMPKEASAMAKRIVDSLKAMGSIDCLATK